MMRLDVPENLSGGPDQISRSHGSMIPRSIVARRRFLVMGILLILTAWGYRVDPTPHTATTAASRRLLAQ